MSSPGPNEIFVAESGTNGRVVEHWLKGKWSMIKVPADAALATDGSAFNDPETVGPDLSSADSGQFWTRSNDTNPQPYRYVAGSWHKLAGVPASALPSGSHLAWVADLPGDGALIGYVSLPASAGALPTTTLYRISDQGTASMVTTLNGSSGGFAQNGVVEIQLRDNPVGYLSAWTMGPQQSAPQRLGTNEWRHGKVLVSSPTDGWVIYATTVGDMQHITPTGSQDFPGVFSSSAVITSQGTLVGSTSGGIAIFRDPAQVTRKTVSQVTSRDFTAEPATDTVWMSGQSKDGRWLLYRATQVGGATKG